MQLIGIAGLCLSADRHAKRVFLESEDEAEFRTLCHCGGAHLGGVLLSPSTMVEARFFPRLCSRGCFRRPSSCKLNPMMLRITGSQPNAGLKRSVAPRNLLFF